MFGLKWQFLAFDVVTLGIKLIKMILTEFPGIPRPPKSFNLFFLDTNEAIISTVQCKLKSTEFER